MTPEFEREYRRRQRARATATAVVLAGLAVLFFAITIARMG
jgi:hypothetical protein